jgi:ribosomal protein S18 acetylase RimI-like enzyme
MHHQIIPARSSQDLVAVRELFREYVNWLGIAIALQGLEEELAEFPGKFGPPMGELLLARSNAGQALGCVGLRPLALPGSCEVKRLYVRGPARGTGVGSSLARSVVDIASALGYRQVMLDTLPSMESAIAVYRKLGFEPIPPYWNNVVPGILYFGKQLRS